MAALSLPPAFRVPAYRWYWVSQLVSGMGTWAQTVAQAWLVLQLTKSAFALGMITTLQFLPMLVFPLLGGVLADRLPRRRVLVATQIGAMFQALILGLLVWSGHVQYWEVGVLALGVGLTNAFGNPAQAALVPEIVGRDLVHSAVTLNSVQFNVARLVGGGIGGAMVGVFGVSTTLFLNAASFVPSIIVIGIMPLAHALAPHARSGGPGGSGTRLVTDIGAGVRYALGDRAIRRVLALFGVVGLLGFNWSVATPLLAVTLGAGPAGFGAMQAALGAGSLVAGIGLMRTRVATERRFLAGAVGLGTVLVLLGLSPRYELSLALMFVGGIGGVTASVTSNTRLQLLAVDAYRGRVMSLFTLLMGGTSPIGALLIGGIAQAAGIQVGVMVFGVCLILGLLVILVLDRSYAEAPSGEAAA